MLSRVACLAAVVAIALGCGRSTPIEAVAPVPAPMPVNQDLTALVLPIIDSATLASLEALLGRLQEQSGLLSQLESRDSRMYGLFRELETAQARLNAKLPIDPEGHPLHATIARMTTQVDSIAQSLDRMHRRQMRP